MKPRSGVRHHPDEGVVPGQQQPGRPVAGTGQPSVRPHHPGLRDSFFANPSRRKLGASRELTGARKDGTEIPLEIALAPVQLASGAGVLVSLVDISERKNLQTKLSQSERLAAVGELAAGVAHEINNPVNTMINCAQLVVDGDDAASNCQIIMEEGARIASIVKDLLQFARDDRGRPQPTALAEVIARTLRLMGESIKRHGIRLEVDVADELPPVLANPDQLQQVLLNLVINAKDALQHAPSPEHRCITIAARPQAENGVRCSVRDTGPGIAPELGARIFEPFVTTKRARGGTGTGLSVSRSIVESFGGTLAYESVPGEGAEFWCVLPLATTQEDLPEGDFAEG